MTSTSPSGRSTIGQDQGAARVSAPEECAAVDLEDLTGDEGGLWPGEVLHGGGRVLGSPGAPDQGGVDQALTALVGHGVTEETHRPLRGPQPGRVGLQPDRRRRADGCSTCWPWWPSSRPT